MSVIEYPKGFKVDKTVRIELDLWEKFRRHVGGNGQKITFVISKIIKDYLEAEKNKKD
jgi:hypothetical protein